MEKTDTELTDNLKQYYNILKSYRNGAFGEEHLSLYEILVLAEEKDLLNKLTKEEIEYLINHNTGFVKLMFIELKKKRFSENSRALSLNRGGKYEN